MPMSVALGLVMTRATPTGSGSRPCPWGSPRRRTGLLTPVVSVMSRASPRLTRAVTMSLVESVVFEGVAGSVTLQGEQAVSRAKKTLLFPSETRCLPDFESDR